MDARSVRTQQGDFLLDERSQTRASPMFRARGARAVQRAAQFEISAERVAMYARLHRDKLVAPKLASQAKSLRLLEATGPSEAKLHRAQLLGAIASSLTHVGELEVAQRYAEEALWLGRPLGDPTAKAASEGVTPPKAAAQEARPPLITLNFDLSKQNF